MQNKTISFETAEAAVMQTWKSLLKQTNPYLVPILLPMIEHFKPLFQEFYDLGVNHGKTAQVPVLDKPACVGNGTFQTGVKWSAVIGAAQRQYEYKTKDPVKPIINPADMLRVATGELVLVDVSKHIIIPKGTASGALND